MKATKNMNIAEIKAALDKYTAKHPITDKFDLQGLQLCEYAENIRAAVQTENTEAVNQIIADIYNYGFMNGAKQTEKQTTDKYNKVFDRSIEQHHKGLAELVYNLPFGIGSDYFYTFMVLMLDSKYEGVADMLPAKQRKAFCETVKQSKQRKESELNNKIA